jgi:hypothetical protein
MSTSPTETALKRCNEQIAWYTNSARWMRWCHYGSQAAVIILTATVPLLALSPHESNVLQACLAALAAILVSMSNLFQWHNKWMARAFTGEVLKSERVRFETGAGDPYVSSKSADEAARAFLLKVEDIAANELTEWKKLQSSSGER